MKTKIAMTTTEATPKAISSDFHGTDYTMAGADYQMDCGNIQCNCDGRRRHRRVKRMSNNCCQCGNQFHGVSPDIRISIESDTRSNSRSDSGSGSSSDSRSESRSESRSDSRSKSSSGGGSSRNWGNFQSPFNTDIHTLNRNDPNKLSHEENSGNIEGKKKADSNAGDKPTKKLISNEEFESNQREDASHQDTAADASHQDTSADDQKSAKQEEVED